MFKFNEINSKSMNVIVEEPESLLVRAPQRLETITIDGRDDDIYNHLGHSPVNITLKMFLTDIEKLDDVKSWLFGSGTLEYKDRYTTARFYTELNPIRTSGIRVFDISLLRAPFWYKKDDTYSVVTNNIVNEGNVNSLPFIKLTKTTSQKVTITINDVQFIYDFKNDTNVIIDCKEFDATFNNLGRNKQLEIGFEFPVLKPGNNSLKFNSGTCKIEVMRKDCWL